MNSNKWSMGLCAAMVWMSIFLLPVFARAVQVQGMGVDRDHALTNALQVAVEQVVGVTVKSSTDVVDFQVIKDEIVTHSKGYVKSYKIIEEIKEADGGFRLTVDAQVDAGQIETHAQTLEILMKMAGHPRILVFGEDSDINAVPSGTEIFDPLVASVSEVFRDKFRFEVVDWPLMRARFKDLPGKLDKDVAIANRSRLQADYYVSVELEMIPDMVAKSAGLNLDLKGVRISDGHLLGQSTRDVGSISLAGLKQAQQYRRAVSTASEDVFIAAADVATALVKELQSEVDRGTGFRYTLGFFDFPDTDLLEREVAALNGYVRHEVDKVDAVNFKISYWSNLQGSALAQAIGDVMHKHGYKVLFKQDGRTLKFKWENPEGF
ncbi:hypothetical protein ACTVJH_05325 [Desulfoplanes sp. PS50]